MSNIKEFYFPAVAGSFTPVEVANHVRDIEKGLADYVHKMASELKISKTEHELLFVPCEKTGDTAIAKSNIGLADGRQVSRIGYASAQRYQSTNVELLVSLAVADATVKAISSVESLPSPCGGVFDLPVSPVQENVQISIPVAAPEQKEFKHRHDKRISDKQKEYLTNMAKCKQFNPQEIAVRLKGKSVKELSSADANDVIQWIKNN